MSNLLFFVESVLLENPISSLQIGRIKNGASLMNIANHTQKKKRQKVMSAWEGSCGVGLWYHVVILASVKSRGAASCGIIMGCTGVLLLDTLKQLAAIPFRLCWSVQRLPVQSLDGSRCIPAPHNLGYSHSSL